jgi:hypothetical protein
MASINPNAKPNNKKQFKDKTTKQIYAITADLMLAICDPMDLSLTERKDWLNELKVDYLKKFNKEFIWVRPKKHTHRINMHSRFSSLKHNKPLCNLSDDDDDLYGTGVSSITKIRRDTPPPKKTDFWDWINNDDEDTIAKECIASSTSSNNDSDNSDSDNSDSDNSDNSDSDNSDSDSDSDNHIDNSDSDSDNHIVNSDSDSDNHIVNSDSDSDNHIDNSDSDSDNHIDFENDYFRL